MRLLRRIVVAMLVTSVALSAPPRAHAQRGSDTSFAALVARLSEAGGYFDSDNIITNEASYLQIASQLQKQHVHGGVYIGVGPDQNFSYIALIRPTIAFMLDIRRDNMLEHLLFKSYFEVARNRLEYLCLLLGKPTPSDVDKWTGRPMQEVLAYVGTTKVDSAFVAATRRASDARIDTYGVPLEARDHQMIDRYRATFVNEGLDTRYSSIGRNNRNNYPSFGRLMLETDREGRERSYLADESAYQLVRSMQLRNRIVPVVGNVAGDKAVKAIAEYATEHHAVVSAFYLSNVEQYLMTRQGGFDVYARNVGMLPHDSTSVIIRSYFGGFSIQHPLYVPAPGSLSASMIEPMDSFLRAFAAGELWSYSQLVSHRYVTP